LAISLSYTTPNKWGTGESYAELALVPTICPRGSTRHVEHVGVAPHRWPFCAITSVWVL
jgi:hypothetical protein